MTVGDLKEKGLHLALMITHTGRSISRTFPELEQGLGDARLFLCPEELGEILPKSVVEHLKSRAQPGRAKTEDENALYQLPRPDELPVLFGARMSMSFPILFSAVPLWECDEVEGGMRARRVLMSDGGLTSNFPIHFFDAPLPGRPTFAINLVEQLHPHPHREPLANVEMYEENADDRPIRVPSRPFTATETLGPVGWLGLLFENARNWFDNEQAVLPGYRERIAHVSIYPEAGEGGLNLQMNPSTILNLVERGQAAGQKLLARFGSSPTERPNWEDHRLIRLKGLGRHTWDVGAAVSLRWNGGSGGASYADLLCRLELGQDAPIIPVRHLHLRASGLVGPGKRGPRPEAQ